MHPRLFGFLAVLLLSPAVFAADNARVIVLDSQRQAEDILVRLKKGEDFAVVAREKSVDATAMDGGYVGTAPLAPELRNALQSLRPGQLSGVVKTSTGYAILKVLLPSEVTDSDNANRARKLAISAAASVKYAPDASGLPDAENLIKRFAKPDDWNRDPHTVCDARKKSLAAAMGEVEKFLDPANKQSMAQATDAKPIDLMEAYSGAAQLYAYKGEMDQAIVQWTKAYEVAEHDLPQAVPLTAELLGVAYLQKSAMDNGVFQNPGDKCLFPMPPAAKYAKTASSERAVEYFLQYLKENPADLEVKWLLNITYMTLGSYPANVPEEYLLPPSLFESSEDIGRFVDVAPQAGLNLFGMAGGVIVDDFENNGLFDVVVSSFDNCEPMHYFHNNGDGTFTDRTQKAGLSDQLGGLNLVQADYNNDGCMDILVLRGGWEFPQRQSLLRNNCNGTFTDVTKQSGLDLVTATQTAVWADINNDGFLDLFLGSESGPAQLFLNKGDGTFRNISHAAGIDKATFAKGVVAEDYDRDGYVDFYVSNFSSANLLYHNNHDGTFTEIGAQAGVQGPGRSFSSWFFDYDNDGWPDLFVTSYFTSVDETVRNYLEIPHNAGTLKLYKNLGNGAFRDVTEEAKLDRVFMTMGANFGDLDNDGFLDMYLGTGNPSYGSQIPNVLLHNKGGKSFVDITTSSGTGELHKGHAVAFADIDNDGDEDILTMIGGATPGDSHTFRLFENPGNANDWLNVRLVGVKTNRSGAGAHIKVTVKNDDSAKRSIYRTVGSGGSFGASPLEQHFGLGKSAQILSVEVSWPGGAGSMQTFYNVTRNQTIEIKEFAKNYSKLERHSFRLGGVNRNATASARP